jgi:oxygen-dependent protoporphyrinogen oxidase
MRRVAVIGAGLAGLTAAFRLVRAGERVTLFEAQTRAGGQLFSECGDGFVVEHGAEGYVAGSEAVATLADEVGIAARVVEQLVRTSYRFDGVSLTPLEGGEAAQSLGFQVPGRELGGGIRSFAAGMGELVTGLLRALEGRSELRTHTRVERLERDGTRARVVLPDSVENFDEVVVATNAHAAAHVLAPDFGAPAAALRDAVLFSSVTVSLAYARSDIAHSLDGTGFVVADAVQQDGLRACTFSSTKLPARAPPGSALLRVFFRPSETELAELDDAAWTARAERALASVLGVEKPARRAWVSRWLQALPLFDAAHHARVATLEQALGGSGVRLAGAAFHGSGIDAAVRSAFRAAPPRK